MTREERAQRWLIDYFEQNGHRRRAGALRNGCIISMNNVTVAGIMLAFADAEAAAMRERAAKLCDERGAEEQKGFGLTRAAQNYFRARDAIRALPATGEVGRG